MTTNKAEISVDTPEVKITRVFNAPKRLVWQAWSDPRHLMKWWGPKDFTSPACRIDFKVGGTYLFCMESSEGQKYWSTGKFLAIEPQDRIVFTDNFSDEHGNIIPASAYGFAEDFPKDLQVTLLFKEVDGKTHFTLIHTGLPAGEISDMTAGGWNESFDKLVEALKS